MQIAVKNKDIFPGEARELLQALYSVGFFEESMLIGSWVMPLYQDAFDIRYALRTQDIDFAVKFVLADRGEKVDIEKIITDLGYIPVLMQSGIRRFTRRISLLNLSLTVKVAGMIRLSRLGNGISLLPLCLLLIFL